jgi:ribosomal-protein-alanine N-acetyltransferase
MGQVTATRPVRVSDAPVLAQLLRANADFLAPWSPVRAEDYATVDGQAADVREALGLAEQGGCLPHVILDGSGEVVGRVTLSSIIRGAFQSCSVGYWVGAEAGGRGLATAAVGDVVRLAFDDLGLHRVQAETLLHNVASQRVLERNGFVRYGVAPDYLNIAGRWQEHALYQLVDTAPA